MKFVSMIKRYIDKPFVPGGIGPDSYDCMGLVYAYCRDMQKPIPDTFEDLTLDNYAEFYMANKEKVEKVLVDYFGTIGTEVNVKEIIAGDLLVMNTGGGTLFPAIYCGNNKFITSYIDVGVLVYEFTPQTFPVLARRMT